MIEKRIPLYRPTEDIALARIAKQEATQQVDEILDLITSECQIVGELKLLGWSQKEIAQHMGMTQQAVSKRWGVIKEAANGNPVDIKPFSGRAARS